MLAKKYLTVVYLLMVAIVSPFELSPIEDDWIGRDKIFYIESSGKKYKIGCLKIYVPYLQRMCL